MKIKLTVVDSDIEYLNRFTTQLAGKYSDRLDIRSFSEISDALKSLNMSPTDILLVSDSFSVDPDNFISKCLLVMLTESSSPSDGYSVNKFQKADSIYHKLLDYYSQWRGVSVSYDSSEKVNKVVCFASPAGGAGSSTLAMAFSQNAAMTGKNVLYLDLQQMSSSELLFSSDNDACLTDVIIALVKNKGNLLYKLESCLSKDRSGVLYINPCRNALDIRDLKTENVISLIDTIKHAEFCDLLVIDCDFSLNDKDLAIISSADMLIMASDSSQSSQTKISKGVRSMTLINQSKGVSGPSMYIVMNRMKLAAESQAFAGVKILGSVLKYADSGVGSLVNTISKKSFWSRLV